MFSQIVQHKTQCGQALFRSGCVLFGVPDYSCVASKATSWIHQGSQLQGEAGSLLVELCFNYPWLDIRYVFGKCGIGKRASPHY